MIEINTSKLSILSQILNIWVKNQSQRRTEESILEGRPRAHQRHEMIEYFRIIIVND